MPHIWKSQRVSRSAATDRFSPARNAVASLVAAGACGASLLLATSAGANFADRGFELVGPPGGEKYTVQALAAQPDGNAVYWRVPPGEQAHDATPPDGAMGDVLLARRGTGGWASTWLTPDPVGRPNGETSMGLPGMRASGFVFSSSAVWTTTGWANGNFALFMGDGSPQATPLSAPLGEAAAPGIEDFSQPWTVSEDLSSTAFVTSAKLDPADTDDAADIYVRRGESLYLVSRRTDGDADSTPATTFLPAANGGNRAGTAGDSQLRADQQSFTGFPVSQGAVAVSPDGRAIVFATTAKLDPDDTDAAADLYLWRDGQGVTLISDDERTVPGCPAVPGSTTDCTGSAADVSFVGVSEDASVIYFRTREGLIDSDTDGANDIYQYRVSALAGQQLSRATGPGASNSVWPVTVTPDGQLFFAATDRLGVDPPTGTAPVLYRWDGTTIITVAPLTNADIFTGVSLNPNGVAAGQPNRRAVRATRDGSALLFRTTGVLADTDTDTAEDLYLWRAGHGVRLVSGGGASPVSLGSDGRGPTGAVFPALWGGRVMSSDASTVFFTSTDALAGGAGDNGRLKLYEWRDGAGVTLVSPPGDDAHSVAYVDNSSDGISVFFTTDDGLVSADTDGGAIDTYVARIGGGFPEPPPPLDPCADDACQGLPAPAVAFPVAASVSFTGPGNVTSPQVSGAVKSTVSKPKTVRGTKAALRVTLPRAGRLQTSGSGLLRTARTVKKGGHYTVTVKLTKRSRKALQRARKVTRTVRVTFTPAGGRAATVSVRLTFRATAKAKTTKKGR